MRKIPLTQGKYAIIDNEDFEKIKNLKWHLIKRKYGEYYAAHSLYQGGGRKNRKYKNIWMHRLIMNTPLSMDTDHRNGNTLDNRKENLRIATKSQNKINQRMPKSNTSGYKGVHYRKEVNLIKRWRANITCERRTIYLGTYFTKELAAKAYNEAALKYHGEFARINII